jgi:hypothetical protein
MREELRVAQFFRRVMVVVVAPEQRLNALMLASLRLAQYLKEDGRTQNRCN